MRILAVSDLHGDLDSVREAIAHFTPDRLLCCGDWGDPEEVDRADLEAIVATLPVLTTFGNHDPLDLLPLVRNRDGSPILLGQGEVRTIDGLRVAAIGGIWAKSHRLPHYVTDEDVAGFARRVAAEGTVDILMTHGCPVGLADLTPKGTRGGQRCFLDAFHAIAPRVHLCGHLHVPQERTLKDGRRVLNVGATPGGSVVVIEADGDRFDARLAGFDRTP
jgi:Icc-related predicted phosphoesterase